MFLYVIVNRLLTLDRYLANIHLNTADLQWARGSWIVNEVQDRQKDRNKKWKEKQQHIQSGYNPTHTLENRPTISFIPWRARSTSYGGLGWSPQLKYRGSAPCGGWQERWLRSLKLNAVTILRAPKKTANFGNYWQFCIRENVDDKKPPCYIPRFQIVRPREGPWETAPLDRLCTLKHFAVIQSASFTAAADFCQVRHKVVQLSCADFNNFFHAQNFESILHIKYHHIAL